MKNYLVIAMSKSTHEIHKGYIEDIAPHGTRIEEYIDDIISQIGDVHWGVYLCSCVDEETAMREFLNHVNWCNFGDIS